MSDERKAEAGFAGAPGSARQACEKGMREIRRLCDEALDHEMGWGSFCALIQHRLEIETAFVRMASESPNVRDELPPPGHKTVERKQNKLTAKTSSRSQERGGC